MHIKNIHCPECFSMVNLDVERMVIEPHKRPVVFPNLTSKRCYKVFVETMTDADKAEAIRRFEEHIRLVNEEGYK